MLPSQLIGPTKGSGYIFTAQENRSSRGQIGHRACAIVDRLATRPQLCLNYKPGEQFAYKATDPLTLGILLNRALSLDCPVDATAVIDGRPCESGRLNTLVLQLLRGFCSDGKQAVETDAGVFLHLNDWIRFAWWVKRASKKSVASASFVNEAAHARYQPPNQEQNGAKFSHGV
ncbi:hypothetical protein [Candidatus Aalborgicola defluviihabitans]|uniref:hypothetical protein n=1 Tax=Candidatus Aalborgicola defluviihabitans TaxID=3386187 RepID=UPI001ED1BFDD|nr:hypothetical protein [Burkholderiales bacterium]